MTPPVPATTIWYAEHAYPGRAKEDLAARVKNWLKIADQPPEMQGSPTGYEWEQQLTLYVHDGMVGAPCQRQGATTIFVYAP
jgi:hypothetical protein